jgi:Ca2+-binding RTX toxin-like protein
MIGGLVLVLSVAGTAPAATVTTTTIDSCLGDVACSKYAAGTPIPVTVVTGLPGEANRVTVTREGDSWLIRDEGGAALTGCAAVDATAVRCPVTAGQGTSIPGLRISLGDGDDRVVLSAAVATNVDAGAGADEVVGSDQAETIEGGPGADRLTGGGGFDTLDFFARTAGVTVDLGAGTTGEGDTIAGFEHVQGGLGDDTLQGGAGNDSLAGGPGRDQLSGAGGRDTLSGGDGNDRLSGGAGRDRLFGEDGADRLAGDAGDDTLVGDDEQPFDTLYESPVSQGNDVLDGGAGNDRIADPGGRNTVRAGAGRDRIEVRNGRRDRVDCGAGNDRVSADRRDSLQRC